MKNVAVISAIILTLFSPSVFAAKGKIDCSKIKPFIPVDHIFAEIAVTTSTIEGEQKEICKTKAPLNIPVLDIRGRAADWFYCYRRDEKMDLHCDASYKNQLAKIVVRPAMLIRDWNPKAFIDSHMHVLLILNKDQNQLRDTFTRSLSSDIATREVTIEGSAGDWISSTRVQDEYNVRTRFYK